jgi:hypothetical protein
MIRTFLRSAVVAATVVGVVLVAQAAYAGALADGQIIDTNAVQESFTFNTVSEYWSIVALSTSADYDISLYDSSSKLLSGSDYGTGVTDFVAINSNDRALGGYTATVKKYSGTGSYYIQQNQGHTVTTLPIPANQGVSGPSSPDLAFAAVNSGNVISVSDVWLNAGDSFWVNTANYPQDGFFLLESNPNNPATFIENRATASAFPGTRTAEGCTLFTAQYSGWHGLVAVNPGPPIATNPGSGIAYALDRYDPTRPNTCPQRNFPAPTPAGP